MASGSRSLDGWKIRTSLPSLLFRIFRIFDLQCSVKAWKLSPLFLEYMYLLAIHMFVPILRATKMGTCAVGQDEDDLPL